MHNKTKLLIFSEKEYNELIGSIEFFKEVYGDDETPFELEDYFSLVDLGRSIIWKLEDAIKISNKE